MIAKFNLLCNIIIIAILLIIGAGKLRQMIGNKAADTRKIKSEEVFGKALPQGVINQNKETKEQLIVDYNAYNGIYICTYKGFSVDHTNPRIVNMKYEIIYPIKGKLLPNDNFYVSRVIEALDNGAYLDYWVNRTHTPSPNEIIFINDDESSKTTKCIWSMKSIPLHGNVESKLFLEILNEAGWCKMKF